MPLIPAPAVPCGVDGAALCYSDAQTAGVISDYDAALLEANRRLCYLQTWFLALPCPPPGPEPDPG